MKIAILILLLIAALSGPPQPQSQSQLTKADIDKWMTELSNWGRWGKTDELGAVNLITPAKRKQAFGLVKDGTTISLARLTNTENAPDNQQPYTHEMTMSGESGQGQWSIDRIGVSYHGYQHTHLDALCHMFWQGKMYNGFPQQEVTRKGAQKLGIQNLKNGIVSRGILMDIPRLKGVPYLEPGTAIYPADLDAWEKKANVRVSSGDVIFIRTGRWARRAASGPWDVSARAAGLHASCAKWLKQRDIAILGSDAASDLSPSGIPGVTHPIHQLVLIALGVNIFDNCDLEAVSETCARLNRWEFLLTAAPIPISGGTGSPLNPVATF
jgi:kynurenine formamidase